ncbi:MAG: SIR2 family protein [Liquorilactobacillus hordei]|uniref:SIR2 family protein n=1 Tax=Liquorilactobacillus hordei TaxID=468911 RepID=UPI0039ED4F90
MSLKEMIQNNHYPIVFIGSGISKRYLNNFSAWHELIEEYWNLVFKDENLYSFLREINQKHRNGSKEEQDFAANTEAVDKIEKRFNDLFFSQKIEVSNLSLKDAQQKRISPFKFDLANRFSHYEFNKDLDKEEYKLFIQFLHKSRMIITTNYDEFLENSLKKEFPKEEHDIFVGQEGLFDSNSGWSEIYKIHGSISNPNSIVINSKDYDRYDNHSILISAKILSSMIDSPVIFLGYSLKDRNVRRLLTDFSTQLPREDTRKSANRIFVVQFERGMHDLKEELVKDPQYNFDYTLISTDNYASIYSQILNINEGATPYEVHRYQKLIKKIIIDSGAKGSLQSVLISPTDLENLASEIDKGKPIVVAMGDAKYFYVYPDLLSYVKDYFEETHNYLPAVALSFVAHDGNRLTRTPFSKYLKNVDLNSLKLPANDLEKLSNKIDNCSKLDDVIKKIPKYHCIEYSSLKELLAENWSKDKLLNVIIFNIKRFEILDLKNFLLNTVLEWFADSIKMNLTLRSNIRKFLFAYDLLINGNLEQIKKPTHNPKG